MLDHVAEQIGVEADVIADFAKRGPTRYEQLSSIKLNHGFSDLTYPARARLKQWVSEAIAAPRSIARRLPTIGSAGGEGRSESCIVEHLESSIDRLSIAINARLLQVHDADFVAKRCPEGAKRSLAPTGEAFPGRLAHGYLKCTTTWMP
jgi:Domain of unknown function (DUF4158)